MERQLPLRGRGLGEGGPLFAHDPHEPQRFDWPAVISLSITWSMPKLAGFCRGGNFWKLDSHYATKAWAGTNANRRSAHHW